MRVSSEQFLSFSRARETRLPRFGCAPTGQHELDGVISPRRAPRSHRLVALVNLILSRLQQDIFGTIVSPSFDFESDENLTDTYTQERLATLFRWRQ